MTEALRKGKLPQATYDQGTKKMVPQSERKGWSGKSKPAKPQVKFQEAPEQYPGLSSLAQDQASE